MRLFVALPLDEQSRQGVSRLQNGLPGIRWAPSEQLHLTLRFIGEVQDDMVDEVEAALASCRFAPFELALQGVGVFPSMKKPRVLWVGVQKNGALLDLQKQVERQLRAAGCRLARQRFSPHVTIGRPRNTSRHRLMTYLQGNSLFSLPSMTVDHFCLFSSILHADGARHQPESYFQARE